MVTAADKCAPKKLRQNPRVDLSIGGAPEDVAPYEHAIGMVNKAAYLRSGKKLLREGIDSFTTKNNFELISAVRSMKCRIVNHKLVDAGSLWVYDILVATKKHF